jgi:hypothetical protein
LISAATKTLFVILFCLLLIVPGVQFLFHFPNIKGDKQWLAGKTEAIVFPSFSLSDWLSEKYQGNLTAYLQDNIGYRPFLIRFTNEWRFRLFGDIFSNIVVGKDGSLFWKEYVTAYTGQDVIPYDTLLLRSKHARLLQQQMDAMGKKCLFVMLPGKASNNAESLPDYYLWKKKTNNYDLLKKAFAQTNVTYLDLYSYFQQLKKTAPYPLFPKYGTHWSVYGGGLGADTILSYLTRQWHYSFNGYKVDSVVQSTTPRYTDADMFEMLNILSQIPLPAMAYPHYSADTNIVSSRLPKLLFVGDSYVLTLQQSDVLPLATGKNVEYFFYGKGVRDYNTNEIGKTVSDLNLADEIEKTDILIFVFTEINQDNFDFDMCEKLLNALKNKRAEVKI